MYHSRRAVIPAKSQRNPATVLVNPSLIAATRPRHHPSHVVTGHPVGTIVGVPTVGPSRPVPRTIVPTVIHTPAVLRNPTAIPPAPRPVVPGPPVKHRRHHGHVPRIPVAQGPYRGAPPPRR